MLCIFSYTLFRFTKSRIICTPKLKKYQVFKIPEKNMDPAGIEPAAFTLRT